MRAIATSLHHPEVAYVSYDHLALDGKNWIGVAKTTNSGADWKLVWKEADAAGKNIHDAWITERFGPGWGENPLAMTVADQAAEGTTQKAVHTRALIIGCVRTVVFRH